MDVQNILSEFMNRDAFVTLLTFIMSILALGLAQKFIWNQLRRMASHTRRAWDDALVAKLNRPTQLLILAISLLVALRIRPLGFEDTTFVMSAVKILFIAVFIWMANSTLTIFIGSGGIPIFSTAASRALSITIGRVALFSIGILIILDTSGISITPLLASLGIGSLAVALALQDTLSNFFGGVYLQIDRPIRVGDYVKVGEEVEGYIKKIGWRSTSVQLLQNNMVIIPNKTVSSSIITNYNLPDDELAVLVQMGVAYESDLLKVERVTIEVAREVLKTVSGGVASFEPFIRFHTFSDSSINFTVILRGSVFADNFILKHEFIKRVQARYKAENIEIPFPQRVVHIEPQRLKDSL